jgi:hypothetical protein
MLPVPTVDWRETDFGEGSRSASIFMDPKPGESFIFCGGARQV